MKDKTEQMLIVCKWCMLDIRLQGNPVNEERMEILKILCGLRI